MTRHRIDTNLDPAKRVHFKFVKFAKEDEDDCQANGGDDFATRPVNHERSLRLMEECLTREGRAPPDGAGWDESDVARSPDPMDLDAALARVDGDRVFLDEMTVIFLAESPGLMSRVRDALAEADPASLVVPAHNLKNWAGDFVASAMYAELTRLETFGRAGQLLEARASFPDLECEFERLTSVMARSIPEPHPPPTAMTPYR